MSSFKFIETFLFLSLGITFALIVTLVYHFKKRMENMETKCDTMFDIVQKLAYELNNIQSNSNDVYNNLEENTLDSNAYDNLTENITLRGEEGLELSRDTNDEGSDDEGSDDDSESEDESDSNSESEDDSVNTNDHEHTSSNTLPFNHN